MKHVKRTFTVLTVIFLLAFVLAACGGSKDKGQVITFEGSDLDGTKVSSKELFALVEVIIGSRAFSKEALLQLTEKLRHFAKGASGLLQNFPQSFFHCRSL